MIKLNTQNQPLTVSYASEPELKSARRLIVPIQDAETDLSAVAHRVWELASAMGVSIKFIGLCYDMTQELRLRRTLTTLDAMVNDGNVHAESEIIRGRDLVSALKSDLQSGDTVVYWRDPPNGPLRAANPLLQADLGTPIYFLSRIASREIARPNWWKQIVAWIGFIVIFAGFFWLQVEISHLQETAATILQVLSMAGEIGSIWLWNGLLG